MSPTNGQSRCFDGKTESVRWERVFFSFFFFPLSSAACMEMSVCAATDVCASTVVSFLFVEQDQK